MIAPQFTCPCTNWVHSQDAMLNRGSAEYGSFEQGLSRRLNISRRVPERPFKTPFFLTSYDLRQKNMKAGKKNVLKGRISNLMGKKIISLLFFKSQKMVPIFAFPLCKNKFRQNWRWFLNLRLEPRCSLGFTLTNTKVNVGGKTLLWHYVAPPLFLG